MSGPSINFFLIVFLLGLLVSFAAYTALTRIFGICKSRKLGCLYWLINLLILIGAVVGRGRLDIWPISDMMIRFAVVWYMTQVLLLFMSVVYVAIKKVYMKYWCSTEAPEDVERRQFIKRTAVSVPTAAAALSMYGTFYSSEQIEKKEHEISIVGLDAKADGYKIAQLSDVHLGLFFSTQKLQTVLDRIVFEKPQVLVITGDLIDDVNMLQDTVQLLDLYTEKFQDGIYFSWGNHEYFRNYNAIASALAKSKVKVLKNQHTLLLKANKPVYLLGVDYPWTKKGEEQEPLCEAMVVQAMQGVPEAATKILLSHHPAPIDAAYAHGIDLTLTGHTHGGQVAIFGQPILPARYKYMCGMYKHGSAYGYVSLGTGSWFPFRLGCPAEFAIFTLKNKV